jgi:hypothetical protein
MILRITLITEKGTYKPGRDCEKIFRYPGTGGD